MKKLSILFVFLGILILVSQQGRSQSISNVRFEQSGQQVNIYYNITNGNGHFFDVKAYYSTDGGINYYGQVNSATGDIGNSVAGGDNKKITWNALQDVSQINSDQVVFKVVATPNTGFQPVKVYLEDVEMEITNCSIRGARLTIEFVLTSQEEKYQWISMLQNQGRIFDGKGRELRGNFRVKISNMEKTHRLKYKLPAQIPIKGSIIYKNVPEDMNKIVLLEFTGNNLNKYKVKDLPITKN